MATLNTLSKQSKSSLLDKIVALKEMLTAAERWDILSHYDFDLVSTERTARELAQMIISIEEEVDATLPETGVSSNDEEDHLEVVDNEPETEEDYFEVIGLPTDQEEDIPAAEVSSVDTKRVSRSEFITQYSQYSRRKLAQLIQDAVGGPLVDFWSYSKLELAEDLAGIHGLVDPPTTLPTSSGDLDHYLALHNSDKFDPITDPPVTKTELKAVKAKIAKGTTTSVTDLLAQLATEKSQAGRKKIRAALRKAGYRISDHKAPKTK